MTRGRLLFCGIAAGIFAMLAISGAPASDVTSAASQEPELIAATFSSEWCTSCKILKPKVAEIIPSFENDPVTFLELDFTFGNHGALREQAAQHGFADAFDRFAGATGFTLLLDSDTGEIIDTLTANYPEDAMRASVSAALAIAEKTPAAASD